MFSCGISGQIYNCYVVHNCTSYEVSDLCSSSFRCFHTRYGCVILKPAHFSVLETEESKRAESCR